MANNVLVRKINIVLDKPRVLCFDLNAYCEIEERYGSVQAGLDALQGGTMRALRTLLYLGLQHEHGSEGLTEQDVGRLLDVSRMNDLAGSLSSAFEQSLPSDEDAEKNT